MKKGQTCDFQTLTHMEGHSQLGGGEATFPPPWPQSPPDPTLGEEQLYLNSCHSNLADLPLPLPSLPVTITEAMNKPFPPLEFDKELSRIESDVATYPVEDLMRMEAWPDFWGDAQKAIGSLSNMSVSCYHEQCAVQNESEVAIEVSLILRKASELSSCLGNQGKFLSGSPSPNLEVKSPWELSEWNGNGPYNPDMDLVDVVASQDNTRVKNAIQRLSGYMVVRFPFH